MNRTLIFSSAALLAAAASFTSVNSQQNEMSFFITSVGSVTAPISAVCRR